MFGEEIIFFDDLIRGFIFVVFWFAVLQIPKEIFFYYWNRRHYLLFHDLLDYLQFDTLVFVKNSWSMYCLQPGVEGDEYYECDCCECYYRDFKYLDTGTIYYSHMEGGHYNVKVY